MSAWRVAIAFGPVVALYLLGMARCIVFGRPSRCVCGRWTGLVLLGYLWLVICVGVHLTETWSASKARTFERAAPVERRSH